MKIEYSEVLYLTPNDLWLRRMQARLGCVGCSFADPDKVELMGCCSFPTVTRQAITTDSAGSCLSKVEGPFDFDRDNTTDIDTQ